MGIQDEFSINSHFRLMNMGSVYVFLHKKLVLLAASFWVFFYALFLTLFRFLNATLVRFKGNVSNCIEQEVKAKEFEQERDSNYLEQEAEDGKEPDVDDDVAKLNDAKENTVSEEEEEETQKFFFKFKFQTCKENYEPFVSDYISSSASTNSNKYDFLYGKDSSLFLKKPEVLNLTVKELYADSSGDKEIVDNCIEQNAEPESIDEERKGNSADSAHDETERDEGSVSRKAMLIDEENSVESEQHVSNDDVRFLSEKDFNATDYDSDSDSITSSHELISRFVDSTNDGFLLDKDFEDAFEVNTLGGKAELRGEDLELEDMNLQTASTGYEPDDFDDEDSDILEELKHLEESNVEEESDQGNKEFEQEELGCEDKGPKDVLDNSEDSNRLETLWEHQELIEQLKMELKKVRATGLPTILEDDEAPKIMEDLKPWKIDEKFHHVDRRGELHKFYRSYRERMRKLDILNYQKMYALGFLQSKDPLKSISSNKVSGPALTSLLSQKFLPGKRKKSNSDPMMSFIRELHSELEMVYVGQMCLSWEILHWQYEKALEIWDSDPYGLQRYNEVAGEFQQFQVLMQRFIENEPFEGPRVQNYVKNRCVLRNLLQVPVIREDSMKDKKARRKEKDDYTITSDTLVEIMEESIRIFWRFVRADKDAHDVIQKSRKGTQIEPQDPDEVELFTEVRISLQKKEKKLKDILRSGNCILRKFQKHNREDSSSDQVLYFFSQVDMKLVSRVLNMSKLTIDHLLWCRNKLNKINFVSRKIHIEPTFLLFPC